MNSVATPTTPTDMKQDMDNLNAERIEAERTNRSLYVGDLPLECSETDVFNLFQAVAPVTFVKIPRDAVTRKSLGYAYVNFHNEEGANKAMDMLNYSSINGRQIRVMPSQRNPAQRREAVGNVFVKNLSKHVDSKILHETFKMFGKILTCKVCTDGEGNSLGYGFVHFANKEDSQRAIEAVSNKVDIGGQKLIVEEFHRKITPDGKPFTNIYVKNLPVAVTNEAKLRELFEQFGKITSVKLQKRTAPVPKIQRSDENNEVLPENFLYFGFVNFEDHECAKAAVEGMNGREYDGKQMYVSKALNKKQRAQSLEEEFKRMKLRQDKDTKHRNLYVKFIPENVTDATLKIAFEKYGDVESAKIMKDETGKGMGFGFVCFKLKDDAQKALCETIELEGKTLYVAIAERKEDREKRKFNGFNPFWPGNPGQQPMFPPQGGAPIGGWSPMNPYAPRMGPGMQPMPMAPQQMMPPPQGGPLPQMAMPLPQGGPGAMQQPIQFGPDGAPLPQLPRQMMQMPQQAQQQHGQVPYFRQHPPAGQNGEQRQQHGGQHHHHHGGRGRGRGHQQRGGGRGGGRGRGGRRFQRGGRKNHSPRHRQNQNFASPHTFPPQQHMNHRGKPGQHNGGRGPGPVEGKNLIALSYPPTESERHFLSKASPVEQKTMFKQLFAQRAAKDYGQDAQKIAQTIVDRNSDIGELFLMCENKLVDRKIENVHKDMNQQKEQQQQQ